MTTASVASTAELMSEIRDRLQTAHFAARVAELLDRPDGGERIADQLHVIRLLTVELEARLGRCPTLMECAPC